MPKLIRCISAKRRAIVYSNTYLGERFVISPRNETTTFLIHKSGLNPVYRQVEASVDNSMINCPRVAGRSATQRFQLPSGFELPLLIHATMGPRGSAWSKPVTITAQKPLVITHVYRFSVQYALSPRLYCFRIAKVCSVQFLHLLSFCSYFLPAFGTSHVYPHSTTRST